MDEKGNDKRLESLADFRIYLFFPYTYASNYIDD